jgi:hypothetical protein
MTYFLMFQLGFMVIGWLYSLWRIVLAVVVMLLYSVAALDRSLLHAAQVGTLGYLDAQTSQVARFVCALEAGQCIVRCSVVG